LWTDSWQVNPLELNTAGYRTTRGKTFGRGTVHRLTGGEPARAPVPAFEPRVLTEAEIESLRKEMADSLKAMLERRRTRKGEKP